MQDTGRRVASLAVGSVARATLGRLVGPSVASAVGGAVMSEVTRRANQRTPGADHSADGDRTADQSEERMEAGEEFRLCSAPPLDQSVATLHLQPQEVNQPDHLSCISSLYSIFHHKYTPTPILVCVGYRFRVY